MGNGYSSLESVDDNQAWLCQIWQSKSHLSLFVREEIRVNLVGVGKYNQNVPPQNVPVLQSMHFMKNKTHAVTGTESTSGTTPTHR